MKETAKHPVRTAEKTLQVIDQLKKQEGAGSRTWLTRWKWDRVRSTTTSARSPSTGS